MTCPIENVAISSLSLISKILFWSARISLIHRRLSDHRWSCRRSASTRKGVHYGTSANLRCRTTSALYSRIDGGQSVRVKISSSENIFFSMFQYVMFSFVNRIVVVKNKRKRYFCRINVCQSIADGFRGLQVVKCAAGGSTCNEVVTVDFLFGITYCKLKLNFLILKWMSVWDRHYHLDSICGK